MEDKKPGWHNTVPPEPMTEEELDLPENQLVLVTRAKLRNRRIRMYLRADNGISISICNLLDRKERKFSVVHFSLSEEAMQVIIAATLAMWKKRQEEG